MSYTPNPNRYDGMLYRRCGQSGLKLPAVSLGLWHNFGEQADYANCAAMVTTAFDLGITHFDLANNYGPPPGSAERMFGRLLKNELSGYRDQLVISTKAGYGMWDGPYGDGGSKKYLLSSLDQSLTRLGLDYVDIFYHHRYDPDTPVEESMEALAQAVRQGKALYAGVSNYPTEQLVKAYEILAGLGVRLLIHQPAYNMTYRMAEDTGLLKRLDELGVGSIAYSPLAQGLLTDRYLGGIPSDSRAAGGSVFLPGSSVTEDKVAIARSLNDIAKKRGQTLAQMALAWTLRGTLTSVIIGASKPEQITDCAAAISNITFTSDELAEIDQITTSE